MRITTQNSNGLPTRQARQKSGWRKGGTKGGSFGGEVADGDCASRYMNTHPRLDGIGFEYKRLAAPTTRRCGGRRQ